jgi:hypothetical protein
MIISLFPYLDYHESVILQKTRLQDLILIIKSTYQGYLGYHVLVSLDPNANFRNLLNLGIHNFGLDYPWVMTHNFGLDYPLSSLLPNTLG